MPAAQRQTPATAFRDTTAAHARRAASVGASPRVGLAQPRPPAEAPKRRASGSPARPRMGTAWFAFMLTAGMVVTMIGLFYLSGHASVTREGYRRARLVSRLRQEQARRQTLDALKARAAALAGLEPEASFIGGTRGTGSAQWEQNVVPQLQQFVVTLNLSF